MKNTKKIFEDNMYKNSDEKYIFETFLSLMGEFKNYMDNIVSRNLKSLDIDIIQDNDKGNIAFGDITMNINENAGTIIRLFVNQIIKKNKSQLLKKYEKISYDKKQDKIFISFMHLEDYADMINFNIKVKTTELKQMMADLNDYLTSLISEPESMNLFIKEFR